MLVCLPHKQPYLVARQGHKVQGYQVGSVYIIVYLIQGHMALSYASLRSMLVVTIVLLEV